MTLATSHQILAVSCGTPAGRKTLEEEGNVFAETKKADPQLVRISVDLFSSHLKDVRKGQNDARRYLDDNGLAWGFQGQRIVHNNHVPKVKGKLDDLKMKNETCFHDFLKKYPSLVKSAESEATGLGKLFTPALFPTEEEVKGKWFFEILRDKVTDPNDPRAGMSHDEEIEMRKDLQGQEKRNIGIANADMIQKVTVPLKRIVDSMTKAEDGKTRIYDSLITNVKDIVGVMKDMNLGDDPELDAIRNQLDSSICKMEGQDLRTDEYARIEAKSEAMQALERIGSFGKKIGGSDE